MMGIMTGLSHIHPYSSNISAKPYHNTNTCEAQDDCLRWLHSYLPPVVWVFVSFHLHPWDVPVVISWPPMVDLKHNRAISCRHPGHPRASLGHAPTNHNKRIFLNTHNSSHLCIEVSIIFVTFVYFFNPFLELRP